jgi:GH24 family phage-related lysozyme (muramidase)
MDSNNYRQNLLVPFLDKHESYNPKAYVDNNGYTTIGHGFNLDDKDTAGLISTYGKDLEKLRSGEEELDKDTSDQIRNVLLDKHEVHMKQIMPSFDSLKDNEKAALASKYYQLPKNFVDLAKYASDPNQKLDMMREMVKQNVKNPGVLKRNLDAAELAGGPVDFSLMFKAMTPEERTQILKSLNKIENENTKKEVLDRYLQYLDAEPKKMEFPKIKKLLSF